MPSCRTARRLNFDHVGAQIGKDHAPEIAAMVGQVEYSIWLENDYLPCCCATLTPVTRANRFYFPHATCIRIVNAARFLVHVHARDPHEFGARSVTD